MPKFYILYLIVIQENFQDNFDYTSVLLVAFGNQFSCKMQLLMILRAMQRL